MLNVGPAELLMILVVALLVLGPKKLPEAARQIGKAMTEFRRVTAGFQDEVRGVLDEHLTEFNGAPTFPASTTPSELPTPPAPAEDTPAAETAGEPVAASPDGQSATPPDAPPTPPFE